MKVILFLLTLIFTFSILIYNKNNKEMFQNDFIQKAEDFMDSTNGKILAKDQEVENYVEELQAKMDNLEGYATQDYVKEKTNSISAAVNEAHNKYFKELISKDQLNDYVAKTDVPNLQDLKEYVKKDDLEDYATQEQLVSYAKKAPLEDFVKKNNLPSLEPYAKKSNLEEYVTKNDIIIHSDKVDHLYKTVFYTDDNGNDQPNYSTKEELRDYATIDQLPKLEDFAKKTDLPDFGFYATKDQLQGYAEKDQIEGYAKKDQLAAYAKKDYVEGLQNYYITQTDKLVYKDQLDDYVTANDFKSELLGYNKQSDFDALKKSIDEEKKQINLLKSDLADGVKKIDNEFIPILHDNIAELLQFQNQQNKDLSVVHNNAFAAIDMNNTIPKCINPDEPQKDASYDYCPDTFKQKFINELSLNGIID